MIKKLKVFEEVNGIPHFLMKTHEGTRKVPLDKILTATKKKVRDGSGGRYYTSGFHVISDDTLVNEWKNSFKIVENRFMCYVLVEGLSPKPKSRYKMWLADKLILPLDFWEQRIPLGD
tara:strand:+ start:5783 stop:6136 length:354 start_codon:yes stop_codon:yes gene_type:complete